MLKNDGFCDYVKFGAISWKFDILLISAKFGKVYFKSQILVHEYWTMLKNVCVLVLLAFELTTTRSKERKYHTSRQYWYTRNVPVFTNTGTFQYLGPEVYFFLKFKYKNPFAHVWHVSLWLSAVHHISFLLIRFSVKYGFPSQFCIFYPEITQRYSKIGFSRKYF